MFQKIKQWWKHKMELREVMKMCNKIRVEKIARGYGYFFPKPEDKHLFDELVSRGDLRIEPLEGGYMFAEDYNKLYGGIKEEDLPT